MAVRYRSNLVLVICGAALIGNLALMLWRLSQPPSDALGWLFVLSHGLIALSMVFALRRHWRLPA